MFRLCDMKENFEFNLSAIFLVLSLLLFAFYKTSKVRCAKLFMWRFVSRKAGIYSSSFRAILNVASDSKLTTIAADFDNGRIGKLSTGSRVQSFPRLLIWRYIHSCCLLYQLSSFERHDCQCEI